MKVILTKSLINQAIAAKGHNDSETCPIAQALIASGCGHVSVGVSSCQFTLNGIGFGGQFAVNVAKDFSMGKSVQPCEFEMKLFRFPEWDNGGLDYYYSRNV